MSRGSKYSDKQRRAAVLAYSECGCLATVSESMGIPRKTLGDWLRSGSLLAEVRQGSGEPASTGGEVAEVEKNKVGRPTSFKPEHAEQARQLCLMGATDQDLADFFKVTERTIDNWKDAHPEFFRSLMEGKVVADAKVATSLYERALGYSHPETRITQVQGEIVKTTVTKHYPPDYQSIALWLKNRRPHDWRETSHIQVDAIHHTAVVILEPELVAQMDKAAGIIDGECEQVDK